MKTAISTPALAGYAKLLRHMIKDERLNATHVSLFTGLFVHWQRSGFTSPFAVTRKTLMSYSKIASIATYHKCMRELDAYAKNFKRNGIDSNKDLVYYGKLEQNRYYTYKDLEVRKGRAAKGDIKPGEQMHIQIIVSRKDASNSIKLSPLNNSKGKNAVHSQKVGQFDRVAFKQISEALFDRMFDYMREIKESFKYANTLKNGTYDEKQEIKELHRVQQANKALIEQDHSHGAGLIDKLLKGGQNMGGSPAQDDGHWRRKKRKRGYNHDNDQSQGYSMYRTPCGCGRSLHCTTRFAPGSIPQPALPPHAVKYSFLIHACFSAHITAYGHSTAVTKIPAQGNRQGCINNGYRRCP